MNKNSSSIKLTRLALVKLLGNVGSISGALAVGVNLLGSSLSAVATPTPISSTPFDRYDGSVDYTVISKSLSSTTSPCPIATSNASTLTIPTGSTVKKAYLYWSGSGTNTGASPSNTGTTTGGIDNQVTFQKDTGTVSTVTATQTWEDQATFTFNNSNYKAYYYGARADVTSLVTGNGSYKIGEINSIPGNSIGPTTYCGAVGQTAGWVLVVIYEQTGLPYKTLAMYEGFRPLTPGGSGGSSTVNLSGFQVSTGTVVAKTTPIVWQGDNTIAGDTLSVNGTSFGGTNVFNSSGSSTIAGSEHAVDARIIDVSTAIPSGSTSLAAAFGTNANDLLVLQALVLSVTTNNNISGKVFEDVNYGGGSGRNFVAAGSQGIKDARVELYNSSGVFVSATTTDASGNYGFPAVLGNSYTVRVVNNTVRSNRAGYLSSLIPVQTFRTNGLTANVGIADSNRVGGEAPQLADGNSGSATTILSNITAQSITPIPLGQTSVSGIDFGFNFDTIVNTNDGGQGSLRQFILNSNALNNTGLTSGKEVSIFMIPGQVGLSLGTPTTTATSGIRSGVANQLTNGVAIIQPTTPLPPVTDANTTIDGSTQTTNVGETNPGAFGYAGLVGTGADGVSGTVDETSLTAIKKPEIEIQGSSGNVLDIQGASAIVRGVAIRGTGNGNPTGISIQSGANNFLLEDSTIGSSASNFADPGGSNRLSNAVSSVATDNTIRNNLVGYTGSFGVISSGSNLLVERNRFAAVGLVSLLTSYSEQMRYSGNGPAIIKDNYFDSTVLGQIDLGSAHNVLVDNNTLTNGHSLNSNDSYENAAIHARGGADIITISHNIISNTQNNAHGIMVQSNGYGVAASRIKITQNSIFNSGKLGINLNPTGQNPRDTNDGVTPNDGLKDPTSGNNGMDYPFITSSKLNGSTLTLKGYVGTNNPLTRANFAAATVEFFIAANNTNDLGPVFSTDLPSIAKLHAEGQTYLGKCTTDANGRFGTVASPCAINVPTGTDPLKITSTATDPAGNTSEFSAELGNDPQLVLVKRVTKIGTTAINTTIDDTRATSTAANDNHLKWPLPNTSNGISPILVGSIDTAKAKPGEEIEYTIYFLSAGNAPIKSMNVCDLIPANTTYVSGSGQISFNGAAASALSSEYLPTGAIANTAGIGLCRTPRNPALDSLTAAENPRGLVWVKIDDYQTPLAPFDYGYIRFRALVNLTNP
jgi:uncharacterized repeat protein (TIGR01451 family)